MKLSTPLAPLFEAYTKINQQAFAKNDVLLACPTLSKSPTYGNILERYLTRQKPKTTTKLQIAKLSLRYCAVNFGHLCFLIFLRCCFFLMQWHLPTPLTPKNLHKTDRQAVIIDTFTLLPKIAKEACYTELYLPSLAAVAAKEGYIPCHLFRLYGSRNPVTVWRALRILSCTENSLTDAHLLTVKDWLKLLRHIVVYPFALTKLIRSLAHHSADSPEQAIKQGLIDTAGQCVVTHEARRLAGYRLGVLLASSAINHRVPPPKIITWFENQTVNKTLHRGLRQAAKQSGHSTPIIGAQLFLWSEGMLNNHADDMEASLGLAPDVVVVNGSYFIPEHSTQRYLTGPSLRYTSLFKKGPLSSAPYEPSADKATLVLLSYHPHEAIHVLKTVLPLVEQGEKLLYKFHPATNPTDYATWLPPNASLLQGPLDQALEKASVVIGSGSGALAESVCLGLPVIAITSPTAPANAGLNHLPPFGQNTLWAEVNSPQALQPALNLLRTFQGSDQYRKELATFRSMLFTNPSPDAIRELLALA